MGGSNVRKISNRTLIPRMILWGWERSGNRGDLVRMRRRNELGQWDTAFVEPEQSHKGMPGKEMHRIYDLTGCSEEQFWTEAPPTEATITTAGQRHLSTLDELGEAMAESARQSLEVSAGPLLATLQERADETAHYERGIQARIVSFMSKHPGRVFTIAELAKELGFTNLQVTGGTGHAVTKGLLERTGNGQYRYPTPNVAHQHAGTVVHEAAERMIPDADPMVRRAMVDEAIASSKLDGETISVGKVTMVGGHPVDVTDHGLHVAVHEQYARDHADELAAERTRIEELDADTRLVDEMLELMADRIPTRMLGRVLGWRTMTLELLQEMRK